MAVNIGLVLIALLVVSGVLVGTVAVIGRRHKVALDHLARLNDANNLLQSLHQLTGTLPASLDKAEVLATTLVRLKDLVDHDTAVVAVPSPSGSGGTWTVVRQGPTGQAGDSGAEQLPAPAARAMAEARVVTVGRFEAGSPGFGADSWSAIYAPLTIRGRSVGLLAVESRSPAAFGPLDEQALAGFTEPVALAIDNARLFSRIQTVSASDERARIARDIHDRIGQALAGVGFDLDRLTRRATTGAPVTADALAQVRTDLRSAVSEVRDAIGDLRTDVTDASDLVDTVHEFATRVAERSGLTVSIDAEASRRLAMPQEREMWRITQEALVNVERHAEATEVSVLWRCDAGEALLEVVDNGRGLPTGTEQPGRPDSYGIIGMRERAASIGATLDVTSRPGEGTKVRCFLALR